MLRRELFCSRDHEDRYFSQQTAAALERMMPTEEPAAPPVPAQEKIEEETEKVPPPVAAFVKAAGAPFEALRPQTEDQAAVDPEAVVAPPATPDWSRLPEPELALGDWIPETSACGPAHSIHRVTPAEIVFHGTTAMPWDLHLRSFPADTPNPQPLVALWSIEAVNQTVESVLAAQLWPHIAGASSDVRTGLTGAPDEFLPAVPTMAPEPLMALWPAGVTDQAMQRFAPPAEVLPAQLAPRIAGAEAGDRAGLATPENLPASAPVLALWSIGAMDQTVERFASPTEVLPAQLAPCIAGVEAGDRAGPAMPENLPPPAPVLALWSIGAVDQTVERFASPTEALPVQLASCIARVEAGDRAGPGALENLLPTAPMLALWSISAIDQTVEPFTAAEVSPAELAPRFAGAEANHYAGLATPENLPPTSPAVALWSIGAMDQTVERFAAAADALSAQVAPRVAGTCADVRAELGGAENFPAAARMDVWPIGANDQAVEQFAAAGVLPAQVAPRVVQASVGVNAGLAAAAAENFLPAAPRMAPEAALTFELTPCYSDFPPHIAPLQGAATTRRFGACSAIRHFSPVQARAVAIARVPQGTWTNPRPRETVIQAIPGRRGLRIGAADLQPGFIARPAGEYIAFSFPAPEELTAKGFTILAGTPVVLMKPALEREQRWISPAWHAYDSITACRFAPNAVFAAAGPVGFESVWHINRREVRDRDGAAGSLLERARLARRTHVAWSWEAVEYPACCILPAPCTDLNAEVSWQIAPIDSQCAAPELGPSRLAVLTPTGPADDPTESRVEPAAANPPRPASMVVTPAPARFAVAGGLRRQRAIGGSAFARPAPAPQDDASPRVAPECDATRTPEGLRLADSPKARPLGRAERIAFDFSIQAGADLGGCRGSSVPFLNRL